MDVTSLLIGAGVTSALGGAGWLLRRKLTDQSSQERTVLYAGLADLHAKMTASGLSVDDVRKLEQTLFSPSRGASPETVSAVVGEAERVETAHFPDGFWTTSALQARVAGRLGVLDAEIGQQIAILMGIWSDEHASYLKAAHAAWKRYRDAAMVVGGLPYDGGTYQRTAEILSAISVSESYLMDLKQLVKIELGGDFAMDRLLNEELPAG